jgi:hypothetical protein
LYLKSSLAIVLTTLCALTACGSSSDETVQSSPTPTLHTAGKKLPLKFKVIGKCYSETGGGTLLAKSSGFTPNSTYSRKAWYPKKRGALERSEYTFLKPQGHTTADGKAVFKWDCDYTDNSKPDPPGTYKLRVIDDSTGRSLTVYFKVLPAQK